MSGQPQPERQATPSTGPPSLPLPTSAKLSGSSIENRPHIAFEWPEGTGSAAERRVDRSHAGAPADDQTLEPGREAPAAPRAAPTDDELLLEASQIAEHLRSQSAELDRREQALNEQLSLLDQERRRVRLWIHQF